MILDTTKKPTRKPIVKKQEVPEGKVKTSLFLRETTYDCITRNAEYMNLKQGAFLDLIFSDEAAVHDLIAKHMAAMPSVLKVA